MLERGFTVNVEPDAEIKLDPRPFSEQRRFSFQVGFALNPDRLIPSLVPGVGTAGVYSLVELRETWYCDAGMNPINHPYIAPFLYSSAAVARKHSLAILAVTIWSSNSLWAIVQSNESDLKRNRPRDHE
jgi:hypothetical protein